jgi:S-disulfanyl-L-cysteine oxidoreductase SoxD
MHTMTNGMLRTCGVGVAALTASIATASGQTASRTVLDGVYTAEQAAKGEAAYTANCAPCHRDTLEGNAEALSLKGERFIEAWRDESLNALFTHMRTRMPRWSVCEPGSLKETVYADILSYILKVNGYPSGASELTTGSVKSTQMVGRNGAQRLPTNATVRVVGCLTPGARDSWMLSRASDPVRTRNAQETSPQELKESAEGALGAGSFRLLNLDELRAGFMPSEWKGHKVQAKGVLTWQDKNDRIYVLSLESVGDQCDSASKQ